MSTRFQGLSDNLGANIHIPPRQVNQQWWFAKLRCTPEQCTRRDALLLHHRLTGIPSAVRTRSICPSHHALRRRQTPAPPARRHSPHIITSIPTWPRRATSPADKSILDPFDNSGISLSKYADTDLASNAQFIYSAKIASFQHQYAASQSPNTFKVPHKVYPKRFSSPAAQKGHRPSSNSPGKTPARQGNSAKSWCQAISRTKKDAARPTPKTNKK